MTVCIHGKYTDGKCSDCDELYKLRLLEGMVRDETALEQDSMRGVFISDDAKELLANLDAIRTARGPGALGACTCRFVFGKHDPLKKERVEDIACPQHGRCTCPTMPDVRVDTICPVHGRRT